MSRDLELDLLGSRITAMEARQAVETAVLRSEIRLLEKLLRLEIDTRSKLAAIEFDRRAARIAL